MTLKLAMNTMTFSMQEVDLLKVAKAISNGGFTGIDLRDSHIQAYVQKGHSDEEIRNLFSEYKLQPICMNSLRDWQHWGDKGGKKYRKFVENFFEESKKVGCEFVNCCAFADQSDLKEDMRIFTEICDIGKVYDIGIALEFLPWAKLRDVQTAWEIVRKVDRPNGGLLIDSFHFFKGGSSTEDLRKVSAEKIFLVHLNDALDSPMDLKEMHMNHRLFPGEGSFRLGQLLDVLIREKKYQGWLVVEVLNKEHQNLEYSEVVKRGRDSLDKLLRCYNF